MKEPPRPPFLNGIGDLYAIGRNVVLITGDLEGPFWDDHQDRFVSLEHMLHSHLINLTTTGGQSNPFAVMRYDGGAGITFFDDKSREVVEAALEGIYLV